MELWQQWVLALGGVCVALTAIWRVTSGIVRAATKVFTKAVDEHVKPIAKDLNDSIDKLTDVLKDVQEDHAREREITMRRLNEQQEAIDDHFERLVEHSERIAKVEGILSVKQAHKHISPS